MGLGEGFQGGADGGGVGRGEGEPAADGAVTFRSEVQAAGVDRAVFGPVQRVGEPGVGAGGVDDFGEVVRGPAQPVRVQQLRLVA